ncbi:MAG TPA: hypothetical protein VKQ31_04730, partial [Steroidobacteraceae bacterium]|nr:hypothetical protein [Steroidobacteraceae bacterium]
AALCSQLIVTRQARLGMNGPEVIEQEAGLAELDAGDRARVWSLMGGEQRQATGFADVRVEDDTEAIARAVRGAFAARAGARSEQVEWLMARLARVDAEQPPEPHALRMLWGKEPAG